MRLSDTLPLWIFMGLGLLSFWIVMGMLALHVYRLYAA
jgi:hypothetical protein